MKPLPQALIKRRAELIRMWADRMNLAGEIPAMMVAYSVDGGDGRAECYHDSALSAADLLPIVEQLVIQLREEAGL